MVYYDKHQRITGLVMKAEDAPDTLVLMEIAELVRKHSVPEMKVKMIEGDDEDV